LTQYIIVYHASIKLGDGIEHSWVQNSRKTGWDQFQILKGVSFSIESNPQFPAKVQTDQVYRTTC